MSKLERLNARVAKLLTEAVQEVLEVVKETVSEYQEKTARTQRENETLKRRLLELQDKITKESTSLLPASVTLPEENQDIKIHMQELSVAQTNNSTVTPTEHEPVSSRTADHSVKEEGKEQEHFSDTESTPECDFALTSTDCCRVEPEEEMCVMEEALTVQTSHRANMKTSSVFSNSPGPFELNVAAIKREAEPANCTTSQLLPLQEHYHECVDLSCNSSRLSPEETHGPQVRTQPYGLVLTHTKLSSPKRHVFAKPNRATFEVTKLNREHFRGDDTHLCVVCGKTFSRVANLRIHQRCHTGEKPYGCAQCGRRFSQAGDLKKHKRVHTGEKPYYCNQCGKSFSRGENLKRHQKIHIGETLHLQQVWREQQT